MSIFSRKLTPQEQINRLKTKVANVRASVEKEGVGFPYLLWNSNKSQATKEEKLRILDDLTGYLNGKGDDSQFKIYHAKSTQRYNLDATTFAARALIYLVNEVEAGPKPTPARSSGNAPNQ